MHSLHNIHVTHATLLAILVSALILWILGAIWYSPATFSKPWMSALGIRPDHAKTGLTAGMISSFIGDLILSLVLWHMVAWARADTYAAGAFIGFLCWLGFIAAPAFPQGIYERRPFKLFVINTGYWLVGLLITGGLLAVWR